MYLFVITHLECHKELCLSLDQHPYICWTPAREIYKHGEDLLAMKEIGGPNYKIFYDHLFYNYSFSSKILPQNCKFIYILGCPALAIDAAIEKGMSIKGALTHYRFRARRIYEMAKIIGGLVLIHEDLEREETYDSVTQFLGIKKPLKMLSKPEIIETSNAEARDCYQRYISLLERTSRPENLIITSAVPSAGLKQD